MSTVKQFAVLFLRVFAGGSRLLVTMVHSGLHQRRTPPPPPPPLRRRDNLHYYLHHQELPACHIPLQTAGCWFAVQPRVITAWPKERKAKPQMPALQRRPQPPRRRHPLLPRHPDLQPPQLTHRVLHKRILTSRSFLLPSPRRLFQARWSLFTPVAMPPSAGGCRLKVGCVRSLGCVILALLTVFSSFGRKLRCRVVRRNAQSHQRRRRAQRRHESAPAPAHVPVRPE